ASKRFPELRKIRHHIVHPVFRIRVRIRQHQRPYQLLPVLLAPTESIRNEKSLQCREPVRPLLIQTFSFSSEMHFPRDSYSFASFSVHQSRRFPCASNFLP